MTKDYETYGHVKIGKGTFIDKGAVLYGPLTIGENCYVGRNTVLGYPVLKNMLTLLIKDRGKVGDTGLETIIGNSVFIDKDVMIYEDSKIGNNARVFHHASIREKVEIGDNSIVGCYTVIDGPDVKIGNNSFIHAQAYICSKTKIGNYVFFGPQAGTINEKTAQSRIGLASQENYRDIEIGPKIEDGASIGEGAKIMAGVVIGNKAVIGAGSVVTKNIPKNEIWVGNPARKLKERDF